MEGKLVKLACNQLGCCERSPMDPTRTLGRVAEQVSIETNPFGSDLATAVYLAVG